MKCIGSGRESCKTFNCLTLTSFPFLLKEISCHSSIGGAGDLSALSVLVPEIDFFKVELIEVGIVQESLVDCGGFADTFRSLISLISSSEAVFCTDFSGKSGAFLQRITGFSWM